MTGPVLLTDSDDSAIASVPAFLDSWTVVVRSERELVDALASESDVRVVVTTTQNPNALRDIFEGARARAIPVVVGCENETIQRRAVEFRADDWYRIPAGADEIAARIRSAIARNAPSDVTLAERAERVEQEQMLYDSLTGLPTLPVMIERSRKLIKERGELVVLYFNFVRYSKIEEIYGWEKLDAVLETTAAEEGSRGGSP